MTTNVLHIHTPTLPVILPSDIENPNLFPSWDPATRWVQLCDSTMVYTLEEMEALPGSDICKKCIDLNKPNMED